MLPKSRNKTDEIKKLVRFWKRMAENQPEKTTTFMEAVERWESQLKVQALPGGTR